MKSDQVSISGSPENVNEARKYLRVWQGKVEQDESFRTFYPMPLHLNCPGWVSGSPR